MVLHSSPPGSHSKWHCAGCLGSRSSFGWHLVFLVAVELALVPLSYRVSIVPLILEINYLGVHARCCAVGTRICSAWYFPVTFPRQGFPPSVPVLQS